MFVFAQPDNDVPERCHTLTVKVEDRPTEYLRKIKHDFGFTLSAIKTDDNTRQFAERGHPVRQRAKSAQLLRKNWLGVFRAARPGGQDVRAPCNTQSLLRGVLYRLLAEVVTQQHAHGNRESIALGGEEVQLLYRI